MVALNPAKRHSTVPAARFENLVVTEAEEEVLVYDQQSHHIHHLNHSSAVIWRLCDGKRKVSEIRAVASNKLNGTVSEEMVKIAISSLDTAGLLSDPLHDDLRVDRSSRRTFLRRAAVSGAIAVPAIVSVTAPVAAASNCGVACTCNSDCSGGSCPLCNNDSGATMAGYCCKNYGVGSPGPFPCITTRDCAG